MRALGNTGLQISPIGLGTVKFGRNQGVKYPNPFEIPDDKHIRMLLKCARDLGVNLLDTAPAYGNSEERLGQLLDNRQDWIINTKVGEEYVLGESQYNYTPEHTKMSIKRSLQRLKTDYLDIVLVHSNGNDVDIIQTSGILDCLSQLKQEGFIRAFGMSTKTIEGGLMAIQQSDVVMATYNPIEVAEKEVIMAAHKANKGILIKKALASGHLNKIPGIDPVATSLEFIFQEPGVSSVIIGTLNPKHLAEAVSVSSQI